MTVKYAVMLNCKERKEVISILSLCVGIRDLICSTNALIFKLLMVFTTYVRITEVAIRYTVCNLFI